MERQGSVGKSAGKGFLYKIAHPQRYKREQQEEMQMKRSASPAPPLTNEIQHPREQSSTKEAIVADDSSSIRSLPSSSAPPVPAAQQQPRPSTPQPVTMFPTWPEYVDYLDSSETVHSALYFPLSQPALHARDSSMATMPPLPPPSTRSSLLRRSRNFMDKPEDDDHTSFSAFGHPSASSTSSSSDTSSVRTSRFTRSSSSSSEVSTPATTPSTSPRPSLSLNGSRSMSSSSSGKNPASFGIAAALAGATGVSTAMVGVAKPDDQVSLRGREFADDSASEYSVASSIQSAVSEGRGRSGFVKRLGLKK
ncbi:hypothetical protein BGZ81_010181 [Podila clonocystis]|nr:hypothetical protein BGZ81_010181 [Podila clonocystis]